MAPERSSPSLPRTLTVPVTTGRPRNVTLPDTSPLPGPQPAQASPSRTASPVRPDTPLAKPFASVAALREADRAQQELVATTSRPARVDIGRVLALAE